jgi:hypothetical protein
LAQVKQYPAQDLFGYDSADGAELEGNPLFGRIA